MYAVINGGYFNITLSSGGKFRGSYSCFFLNDSDVVIDIEPDDETFEFGAIREDRGLSARPLFREETNLSTTQNITTIATPTQ